MVHCLVEPPPLLVQWQRYTNQQAKIFKAGNRRIVFFAQGRTLHISTVDTLVCLDNSLSADMVTLFAQRHVQSFNSQHKCYCCAAGPSSRCHLGSPLADPEEYIFLMCVHTDFCLHFLTNWLVRLLRVIEVFRGVEGGEVFDLFCTEYPETKYVISM